MNKSIRNKTLTFEKWTFEVLKMYLIFSFCQVSSLVNKDKSAVFLEIQIDLLLIMW